MYLERNKMQQSANNLNFWPEQSKTINQTKNVNISPTQNYAEL